MKLLSNTLDTSAVQQQNLIIQILKQRFGQISLETIDGVKYIRDLEGLSQLLQQAISIDSLDNFDTQQFC